MNKKLLVANTLISVIYQVIVVICGFVLPRVILETYGSEVNGLVNSITQFISVVSMMELGVGAVVSSNLYGPLAEKKWNKVNIIISSSQKFFRNIGRILLGYIIVLFFTYPHVSNGSFDAFFSGSLILIISINSFAQYYIGVVDNIILGSDQRAFIVYGTQAIAHLLNTIICVVIMHAGAGIHIVKGATAIIYLLRPLLVRLYIKSRYPIKRNVSYEKEPLKQKWNAIAQHISECVLDSTDVIILTVFSSLSIVSVYYVYNLVVYNLKNFFLITASSAVLPVLGKLYATKQDESLRTFFDKAEWLINIFATYVFGVTAVLIIPFITVYTNSVTDVEYIQPMFSILIVLAHACHCLRLPYFLSVKAAGHYKETQMCFITSTVANIIISIILVNIMGLVGVAIGTLVAMLYQTIWLAVYAFKNILNKKIIEIVKRLLIDAVIFTSIVLAGSIFTIASITYTSWFILAIKVALVGIASTIVCELLLERKKLTAIVRCKKGKVL